MGNRGLETMAYRSRFECGHILISAGETPKEEDSTLCPEHGETKIVRAEKGTIEAYIGFIPAVSQDGDGSQAPGDTDGC